MPFAVSTAWCGCPAETNAAETGVEARFYEKLPGSRVRCDVCPRRCVIEDGERGYCRTRENRGGTLYSLVYGRVAARHVDPIEKKPFFHVVPGSLAYSIATAGCNMRCTFCQNFELSQARPEELRSVSMSPRDVASEARDTGSSVVAFTYNEPTVFTEYARDCAAQAKATGLGSVVVSNGFINSEPLKQLGEVIVAYKVDLKSFSQSFYRDITGGDKGPVLETIRTLKTLGIWTEIVHLTIPTLNDSDENFNEMGDWLMSEIGPDIPVHFTRFRPIYRLTNLPVTPVETLERARELLMAKGLRYVYVGNVPGHPGESTYCPRCGERIIERGLGYTVGKIAMRNGTCAACGTAIAGVWSLEGV